MATGRLASGSIAAGAATQLYRNSTGNAQVITLLASSQVSGSAPKLNVKITSENFTVPTSVTTVTAGTNHTLTADYYADGTLATGQAPLDIQSNAGSGSLLHLSIGQKQTSEIMGQAWSPGHYWCSQSSRDLRDQPWSAISFDRQPMGLGGPGGGVYYGTSDSNYQVRMRQVQYDPYYFENPNAYNQNKARGVVLRNDAGTWCHIEDISKMPFSDLKKWYGCYQSGGSDYYTASAPATDASTYGTVTSFTPGYYNRINFYDVWTGLQFGVHSQGYNTMKWWDENSPSGTGAYIEGDRSSNSGLWVWSNNNWNGSDPRSYDTHGHGSVYGTYGDCDHGLFVGHAGEYNTRFGFKFMKKFFAADTMDNKDTRAHRSISVTTYCGSTYYHIMHYLGSASYQKLQWVKYNPNTDKYYVCFWDNSGSYSANPLPTMGTSYAAESGIFEIHVNELYGYEATNGNTYNESFATGITAGMMTKVASVPDTVSGLMSKPMRLAASLWTAHCQNGKQYFSNDLVTWAEKSSTYIPDAYQMVNASKLGTRGTTETDYYVAASSKSVVYSFSTTVTADVYDQAAVAGIIAKGAVTPYEQKAIILSDGDAIYVENEDATNAISVTAMGVDV